ncbi:MAG: hypothetical protein PHD41_00290 [Methanosarcinaceae archaeon]|nr:hypothetical protein [Methanosarcinaceae archaeon]MDD4330842.1 hypothetical protein [Methanosarcinaceae archaeon]MDD4748937.1 hypothetical protein [Methanosarcinaceae archaeon]
MASKKPSSEAEAVKMDHVLREKVAISPDRRNLLRIVGIFGKSEEELKEKADLSDFKYKYHMDFLLKAGFLKFENGIYRLTDSGMSLHDSVC